MRLVTRSVLASSAALAIAAAAVLVMDTQAAPAPAPKAAREVPRFEVDPTWPKLPPRYIFGQVSSVSIDEQGHAWVLQRPSSLRADQKAKAAPPVIEFDEQGTAISLEEKPDRPRSNYAVPGLYFYDNEVVAIAADLRPSARGELEITDLNNVYVTRGAAKLVDLGRGTAWLDTGTHDSLLEAGQFVQVLEHRQGVRIACVEEIALRQGFIDAEQAYRLGSALAKSSYGAYVMDVARDAGALTIAI